MTSSTGTVVFNDAKLQAIDVVATERLGVGTLDPTSNLHVVGNVHVTGNVNKLNFTDGYTCLLYTSPSPRDRQKSRMPSSA